MGVWNEDAYIAIPSFGRSRARLQTPMVIAANPSGPRPLTSVARPDSGQLLWLSYLGWL